MNTKRHSMIWAAAFAALFHLDMVGVRFWAASTAERATLAALGLVALSFAAIGAHRRMPR